MSNEICLSFSSVKSREEAFNTAMEYVADNMKMKKVRETLNRCLYGVPSVRTQYFCDKNTPYSERNRQLEALADKANLYWLKSLFTFEFLYWEQYDLLSVITIPTKEHSEKWPVNVLFQDSTDHDYDFSIWEGGNFPFFADAIIKALSMTDDELLVDYEPDEIASNKDNILRYQRKSKCYEYIYKTLGLNKRLLGCDDEDVPYEYFALCGVKSDSELFRLHTRLRVLIQDRSSEIFQFNK